MKNEWTGDVDMGDGKVQALHRRYIRSLQQIQSMTFQSIPQLLQQLNAEYSEIDEGEALYIFSVLFSCLHFH